MASAGAPVAGRKTFWTSQMAEILASGGPFPLKPTPMSTKTYMPSTNEGVGNMLTAFATNIPALSAKYGVSDDDMQRVTQAQLVWGWFEDALVMARGWAASLTASRDALFTGAAGTVDAMPTIPALPPVPTIDFPPVKGVSIEHDFFTFFGALVSSIKKNQHYDPADGRLLGIEGAAQPKPQPGVVPVAHVEVYTSGHPEVSCVKGQFQGFKVFLTRPGGARREIGTSLSRRFVVNEALPAPGTAEVWNFEVQYIYGNEAFGQLSAPASVTVRG